MGVEIERRFLLKGHPWWKMPGAKYHTIKQGYLSILPESTVRVRLESYVEDRVGVNHGYITIKGKSNGAIRREYEYQISAANAEEMIANLCQHVLEKRRWYLPYGDRVWHVDVFEGPNRGLAIAEIELDSEDESLELPPWIVTEITNDHRYANSNLSVNPWNSWKPVDNQ